MKILVFTTLFPNNVWPNHGVFVKERMCALARLDQCEIKVVAPVPYYPCIKMGWRAAYRQVVREEMIEGLPVYHPRYVMIPKVGMALHGLMMFLSVYFFAKKIQEKFNFDLIDAHYVYPDGFAAVLLGRCFQKPVVVSARGSDINQFSRFLLIRSLLRYTLGRANKIIAVCRALMEAMIDVGVSPEKITVVPNGVDLAKFYSLPRRTARERLGIPADKTVILSVGSLIPRKGFELLINAFNVLIHGFGLKNLYLIIIGEGWFRRKLEELTWSLGLDDKVTLVGSVPHQELYLWYSAANVSCLSSSREGWPNVVLESLACGTPVVGTKIWGVPEVITCDEIGLLSERREDAMAEGIVLALKKQWETNKLLEYARSHTWNHTALGVLGVFQAALNKSENRSDNLSSDRLVESHSAERKNANT